jgi:hypothetical protein
VEQEFGSTMYVKATRIKKQLHGTNGSQQLVGTMELFSNLLSAMETILKNNHCHVATLLTSHAKSFQRNLVLVTAFDEEINPLQNAQKIEF